MMGQLNRAIETMTQPTAHLLIQPNASIAAARPGC
jgi:hypothetical protein